MSSSERRKKWQHITRSLKQSAPHMLEKQMKDWEPFLVAGKTYSQLERKFE
ncbi:hypothetical protein [Domibacillus tundrae]|uniref:hypothetical protein n=1 Tax=Domibacillus tundrae TaxID=1587527 RepID=UPI0033988913